MFLVETNFFQNMSLITQYGINVCNYQHYLNIAVIYFEENCIFMI